MNKLTKPLVEYWSYYSLLIVASGISLFSNWTLMSLIWVGLIYLIKQKGRLDQLTQKYQNLFWLNAYLYPAIGSFLKLFIIKDIIPYSWFWLNRLEHFSWSFALVVVFFPVFYSSKKFEQMSMLCLSIFCFVQFLGIGNELFEYLFRLQASDRLSKIAYQDTMIDFVMNIFGSGFAIVILAWIKNLKKQTKNTFNV